jgi:hypothetical protein
MRNMNRNLKKSGFLVSVIFALVFLSIAVNQVSAAYFPLGTAKCSILPGDPATSTEYCPTCPTATARCEHKPTPGLSGCACADLACQNMINNDACDWTEGVHICKAVCNDIASLSYCSQVAKTTGTALSRDTISKITYGNIYGVVILQDFIPPRGCCSNDGECQPKDAYGTVLDPYARCLKYSSDCSKVGKNACCRVTDGECISTADCCSSTDQCVNGICKTCRSNGQSCGTSNPCCSGYYCSYTWWSRTSTCKPIPTRIGGGGGCPILEVWDGEKFVDVEKLNIHAPKDQDTTYTTTFTMEPKDGKYELILHEASYLFWDGSHIDSVKLTDESGKECRLISAVHSKDGDVLSAIEKSDDIRVRNFPGDEIRLTYDGCSGKAFTFSIEGHNRKAMFEDITTMVPIAIVIAAIVLAIIFGILKLFTKKKKR